LKEALRIKTENKLKSVVKILIDKKLITFLNRSHYFLFFQKHARYDDGGVCCCLLLENHLRNISSSTRKDEI
jgi:hypothetical protein